MKTIAQPGQRNSPSNAKSSLRVRKILVPLDFSRASMSALKYIIPFAQEFGATIDLVHVQPADELSVIPGAGRMMLNCAEALALMQDRVRGIQKKHEVHFWANNCHVVSGRPYEEICKLARKLGVDLIVLPTRGYSGLKRMALGSTAERVVRRAPCPVLIPRGKKFRAINWSGEPGKFSIRRILAPVDFSKCSLIGLRYAASLAKQFNARVRLVHVVFPYSQVFQFDRMTGDLTSVVKKARKEAEQQLQKICKSAYLRGIQSETEVCSGSTVDEICAESARPDVDLIVTSTHGRTGFSHLMLGSVAEHIIRYAEAPVLVVPSA